MTPLQLFLYGLALAGSAGAIGLVLLGLLCLFYAAVAPPSAEEKPAAETDGRLSDEREEL